MFNFQLSGHMRRHRWRAVALSRVVTASKIGNTAFAS
jgi:hypothetical protein